jgi:hypothetical protein
MGFPHNLFVLRKYQCHVNVEACNKTYLIKYLFKYVNKGFDCAKVGFAKGSSSSTEPPVQDNSAGSEQQQDSDGVDEIAEYIRSRYLSCCEAVCRLLGFEIQYTASFQLLSASMCTSLALI